MKKTIWAMMFVIVAIIAIVFIVSKNQGPESNNKNQNQASVAEPVGATDHVGDNKDSKVVLIEYSDFQCPACGLYYPLLKQLDKEFGAKIAFVYRNFPLQQHKNARPAAYAAEAAGKQGKFFEMHDMLFENQDAWAEKTNAEAEDIFAGYAGKLGLNLDQFKKDAASTEIKDKVEADYQNGVKANIDSTPTFFLNGEKLQNPRNYNEFRDIINKAISANS